MTAIQADDFEKPFVLLCEGRGDERFYKRLFEARNIGDDFHVRVPFKDGSYNGGRSNFGSDLRNIAVNESFIKYVRAVLIISDNDTATSFSEVQAEIRKADGFGVPEAAKLLASGKGMPLVCVLMLPMDRTGNLELLCLEAAYSKWPLQEPLDQFVAQTPATEWIEGKQAKMRIQTILAATNKRQPDTGFAGHWAAEEEYRIPLDHACFDPLVEFLSDFPKLVGLALRG